MPNGGQVNSVFLETLRKEYDVVAASWRFFSGLRFVIAGFVATFQSALLTLYIRALEKGAVMDIFHPTTIPVIGIFVIGAIFLIEKRTTNLFRLMIDRGIELEFRLGVTIGHFSILGDIGLVQPPGLKRLATYAFGLRLIYFVIFALWIFLLIISAVV